MCFLLGERDSGGTVIEVLIVNQAEVPRLLPMKECVDVMARAFASLARGEADMPVRQILWMAEKTRSARA